MLLNAEERKFLIEMGAKIRDNKVYDLDGTEADETMVLQVLAQARKEGKISSHRPDERTARREPPRERPPVMDADYVILDESSDDSEGGYETQRAHRAARGSNRTNVHRSGYSAPQTRSEAEDVDYGYIPTARENRTSRAKLKKEQRSAAREEKGQKQRKIRQYAVNEMKYAGRITFLNKKQDEHKQWVAIDCNLTTGKGLTVEVCSSKEEAKRQAEKMHARHPKASSYTQRIAYTEPSNVRSDGRFKRMPATVYKIEVR